MMASSVTPVVFPRIEIDGRLKKDLADIERSLADVAEDFGRANFEGPGASTEEAYHQLSHALLVVRRLIKKVEAAK